MTSDVLWKKYSALAPTSQQLVETLLTVLSTASGSCPPTAPKPKSRRKLSAQPFVGMWRDRTDMADSVEWVRELRQREWNRTRG